MSRYRRSFKARLWTMLLVMSASSVARATDIFDLIAKNDLPALTAAIDADPTCISRRKDNQETPLHTASQRGQVEVVALLIKRGAEVNAVAYNGFTPLFLTDNAEIARMLIKAGADLNRKDSWGKTPLQNAVQNESKVVVGALVEAGAKIDLVSALMLKQRNLAKRIIAENPAAAKGERGSDLWGNTTPLGIAAGQGDKEMVQLLLDSGADVSADTRMPNAGGAATPLCNAVWGGHTEIVQLLLDKGASTEGVGGKFYDSIFDYAVQHSDPRTVELLLQHGALRDNGKYGFAMRKSPLSIAARDGSTVKIELLFKYGADFFNAEDRRRALFAAAISNKADVVKLFTERGVPTDIFVNTVSGNMDAVLQALDGDATLINARDPILNRSLLSWAIAAQRRDIANALIDRGADVKSPSTRSVSNNALWEGTERPGFNGAGAYAQITETPLLVAIGADDGSGRGQKIDADLVHRLLEKGADPNASGWMGSTPLMVAIGAGNAAVVADLLQHDADAKRADDQGETPLHAASQSKEITALLLAQGADPNVKGYGGMTPLDIALRDPDGGAAELLVSKGASLTLYSACVLGKTEFVKDAIARDPTIIEQSCIPGTFGATPLVVASEHGQLDVMEVLLAAGAKTSYANNWDGTIHSAAGAGQLEAVRFLLDHGADIHTNSYQGTALHRAAMFGQLDVVKFLVDRGARVNQEADNGGWMPLHAVAYRDSAEVTEFLISKGAEVNAKRTDCGRTPLHEAASDGSPRVVAVLLAHGADPSIRDSRGMTALDWAKRGRNYEDADEKAKRNQVVEILEKATPK